MKSPDGVGPHVACTGNPPVSAEGLTKPAATGATGLVVISTALARTQARLEARGQEQPGHLSEE